MRNEIPKDKTLDQQIALAFAEEIASSIPVPSFSMFQPGKSSACLAVLKKALLILCVALAASMILICTALAGSPELRREIGDLIAGRKGGKYVIAGVGRDDILTEAPDSWLGCYWLKEVPAGYTLTSVDSSRTSSVAVFRNTAGKTFTFIESWQDTDLVNLGEIPADQEPRAVAIGSHPGLARSDDRCTLLVWSVNGCSLGILDYEGEAHALHYAEAIQSIF